MRSIDAEALKRVIYENVPMKYFNAKTLDKAYQNMLHLLEVVNQQPTVDAVPVVHGRWVFGVDSETGEQDLKAWTCSECTEKYPWQPNYCPHCGAKMDGGRDDDDSGMA